MRGSFDPCNGGSDLVESQIGESYEVVKEVQAALPDLQAMMDALNAGSAYYVTTADLGSVAGGKGASLAKLEDGRTVQQVLGLANARFYDGTAANLLIQRSTAGPTRVHIESNGYIDSGVSTKLDLMYDPYALDNANYRLFNIYNSTGDLNLTGESGITFLGTKSVGKHFGFWPWLHFGFSDDGVNACAMKMGYYDTTQPQHFSPAKGGHRTGKVLAVGDYVCALSGGIGRIYRADSSGPCGATTPSHDTGTLSDGSINLTWVHTISVANVRPIILYGTRADMPKLGFTENVQHARNELFWNGVKLSFLDQTNTAIAWSIFTNPTTDDLLIQTADGLGTWRFDATGKFMQASGLALVINPLNAADGDTTPSIKGAGGLVFNNSSTTLITRFDDAIPWQPFFTRSGNGQTTLVHSASIRLIGNANRVMTATDNLRFTMNSAGTEATEDGYRG